MNPNTLAAAQLLIQLLANGTQLATSIAAAHSEGRDMTDAELAGFFALDAAARDTLQKAIDVKKAAGG